MAGVHTTTNPREACKDKIGIVSLGIDTTGMDSPPVEHRPHRLKRETLMRERVDCDSVTTKKKNIIIKMKDRNEKHSIDI